MTARKKKTPAFDEGIADLEVIVQKLSQSELTLEESIALYEQGAALAAQLRGILDQQKKRIEMIDPDTAEIESFEENEHDIS